MSEEKQKPPGPQPERLKIEGDPEEAFQKLLKPLPKGKRRKRGKRPRKPPTKH